MEENGNEKKRNYEKYLEGEVWTPQEPQQGYSNESAHGAQQNTGYAEYQPYSQIGSTPNGAPQYGANPGYTAPQPVQNFSGLEEPVSMGEWILSLLLTMIPCVGLIMMFVWAFGKGEKKSKSNFFKAELIFVGALVAFYFIFIMIGIVSFSALSR